MSLTACATASVSDALLQGDDFVSVIAQGEELHELDHQLAALSEVGSFEKRLFAGRVERCDLGNTVDQCFVVEPLDRIPVHRITLHVRKTPSLEFETGPFDAGQDLVLGIVDYFRLDLTEAGPNIQFAHKAKPRLTVENDVISAVLQRFDIADPPQTADIVKRGAILRLLEQLQNNRITVLYIQPDQQLASETQKMRERIVRNVLQEYARSGRLESVILVDNLI